MKEIKLKRFRNKQGKRKQNLYNISLRFRRLKGITPFAGILKKIFFPFLTGTAVNIKMPVLIICMLLCITQFKNNIKAEQNTSVLKETDVDAKGAILIDYETGRILWEKNSNEPLPMASTTKIMTAITAIESGNLSDTVTASGRAASAPPTKMKLTKGEKITLKNLLYALMLQSSNDAAVAIAEHIGTTVENFCNEMTEKAKEIGAKNTVFKTPNGLDSENHHSTAYDMALIARYALKNETFREIITTRSVSFKSDKKSYSVTNKNRLLSEFAGANGVKTGFTGKAGHCFVGSAKRGDLWLISTVLASGWGNKGKEQKWVDTKKILTYGFKNYEYQTPFSKNQPIDEIPVKKSNESTLRLLLKDGLKVCIKKDGTEKINIIKKVPGEITAPVKKGQTVGTAEIYINSSLIAKIDIIAEKNIEKKTFCDYLKDILKFWSTENFLP